jgi:outer membrane protein OmpA-like peptidoglycan-associated protein
MSKMKRLLLVSFLALSIGLIQTTRAQFFDKLKKKTEEKIKKEGEKRAEDKINEGVEKGYDEVEKQIEGEDKTEDDQQNSKKEEQESDDVNKSTTKDNQDNPQAIINSKFDFIPGEKVIFFDDFTAESIGDFPVQWNTNGSGEIVTTNLQPGRWLKFAMSEAIWTDQLLNLPENYTIEFDVIPIKGEGNEMAGYTFRLLKSINKNSFDYGAVPGEGGFSFTCAYFGGTSYRAYINDYNGEFFDLAGNCESESLYQKENKKYHISVWVQKSRVRIYQDNIKLFDVVKAFPLQPFKINRIRFEDGVALISNVRIAAGLPDMRNKLIKEGKLISYGIQFDVNSDKVKPESYATIKEIAAILKDNPTVKIKIVGHTDSDGDDKSNLDLSKRRAASVKNVLVKDFEINAARIETDGKGEGQPIAANDSAVNKALNRRVEFLKL